MHTALRHQLVRALAWEEAHATFDKAINGMPADKRGVHAAGFEHTSWQLLEHLRLAMHDLVDFAVNPDYTHALKWPEGYWPATSAPPNEDAWDESVAAFRADLARMQEIVRDESIDLFAPVPSGKATQTYLRAVLLTLDHNAYHVGQLVSLRKALGVW